MADQDLGLEVLVKAVADEKSAGDAVKALNKVILHEMKNTDSKISIMPSTFDDFLKDNKIKTKVKKTSAEYNQLKSLYVNSYNDLHRLRNFNFFDKISDEDTLKDAPRLVANFTKNYKKLADFIESVNGRSPKNSEGILGVIDYREENVAKINKNLEKAQKKIAANIKRQETKRRKAEKKRIIENALEEEGLREAADKKAAQLNKKEKKEFDRANLSKPKRGKSAKAFKETSSIDRLMEVSNQYDKGDIPLEEAQKKVLRLIGKKSIVSLYKQEQEELKKSGYIQNSNVKPGGTTSERLETSARRGGYDSPLERFMMLSRKDFYKHFGEVKFSKPFKNQKELEEYLAQSKGMKIKRQVIDKKSNGQWDVHYEDDVYHGSKKRKLTEQENAAGISDAIITKIASTIGKIQAAKPDVTTEDLAKYLEAVKIYNEKAGRPILDTILGEGRMAIAKYFRLENFFDLGYGDNDYQKNQYEEDKDYAIKNDPVVIELVKSVFNGIQNQVTSQELSDAEALRQRRAEVNLTKTKNNLRGIAPEDNYKGRYKYGKGVSMADVMLKNLITPEQLEKTLQKSFGPVTSVIKDTKESLKTSTDTIKSALTNTQKTSEKALAQEKVADVAQLTTEKSQETIAEENKDANKKNSQTGLDTDEKADELIHAVKTGSTTTNVNPAEVSDLSYTTDIEESGSPYEEIFKSMNNALQYISAYIKACYDSVYVIANKVDKLKISVSRSKSKKKEEVKKENPHERIPTSKGPKSDITGLPDLYRYFENGKWKTAGVRDTYYSEGLKELSPYKEPSKHTKHKIARDTSNETYKEIALNKVKQLLKQDATKKALIEHQRNVKKTLADHEKTQAKIKEINKRQEEERQKQEYIERNTVSGQIGKEAEEILTKPQAFKEKLKSVLGGVFAGTELQRLANMNEEERAKEYAKRIEKYGEPRGKSATDTGDIARIKRTKSLWRGEDSVGKNKSLFQDIQLTPGIGNVDTDKLLKELQSAITKNMFTKQTGGWINNILGAMTGGLAFAFQPSLEKSRAQMEALNQMLSDVRTEAEDLVNEISGKEAVLKEMENSGNIKLSEQGNILAGTITARKTFTDYENQKDTLRSILMEITYIDDVIKKCGGDTTAIFKTLGFMTPELRKENKIIQNINAGLDKNGKVLKFQRRSQEVLNYTFQLMSRSIGQMLKRWLLMLNPISLIKRAFQDFASYDVKWQRTMNVIKYNIRRIIKPFMEWLAQQLVNIIGLGNALIKGIGKVFGYDWDLFDQTAANTEKMAEEIQNVSAGFDELHDIGSDNTGANDLLGDIYKPQWTDLYKDVEAFGENVANVFKGIGDFFSELDFWGWLKLAGGALVGFLALKTLIEWFHKGKNPLQTVANGFSFLEKAVGWSALILSFGAFVKILGEFIDLVGNMEPEQIDLALGALGRGLLELGGAIAGIEILEKLFKLNWKSLLGEAGLIASLALLTDKFKDFIKVVGEMKSTQVVQALDALQGSLGTLAVVLVSIITVLGVFSSVTAGGLLSVAAIIAAIALMLEMYSHFIESLADLTDAVGRNKDAIIEMMESAGNIVQRIFLTVGAIVITVINTIGNTIVRVIDTIITKITELITVVVTGIGGTIKDIIQTVGNVIIGVIEAITDAIPKLLNSILNFCWQIGPAIENSISAIMRGITKLINFIISAVEYVINTLLIGSINGLLSKIPFVGGALQIGPVSIPRFVPKYEKGTNYVPNDGLAYLHQGEAVVPKKYNQPYNQGLSNEEKAYMQQMMTTMRSLDGTLKQGIPVSGQFVQRGSDLVAVVNKTKSQIGADLLSNVSYAR